MHLSRDDLRTADQTMVTIREFEERVATEFEMLKAPVQMVTASLGLIAPAGLGPEINGDFLTQLIGADKRRGARLALSQLVADAGLISRDMIETFLRYKRTDGVPAALETVAAASFDGDRQANVFADRLGEIEVPILCVWGEQDEVVPPAHASSVPDHAK